MELTRGLFSRGFRAASGRLQRYSQRAYGRLIKLQFQRLGLDRAEGIRTWTSSAELRQLHRLASGCPPQASVVELGSYLGASTCYLAAGLSAKGGRIVCVDTWQNETMPEGVKDTHKEFQDNTASVASMLTILRKPTADLRGEDLPAGIHLAFIDADHSYEATRADTNLLLPLMAPDGVLVFHDTACYVGVSRVVGEVLAAGQWSIAGNEGNLTWLRRGPWMRDDPPAAVPTLHPALSSPL